jgi:hypothetical protein
VQKEISENQDKQNSFQTTLGPFCCGYYIAAAGFVIWMTGFGISNTFGIFYKPMMADLGLIRHSPGGTLKSLGSH